MLSPDSEAPAGDDLLRHRYRVLRRLLAANSEMLELMADLEADLSHLDPGEPVIVRRVLRLLSGSLLLAENLNILTGAEHRSLYAIHAEIEEAVRATLRSFPDPSASPFLVSLEEASAARVREVGGKAAGLGPLLSVIPGAVPPGFVLTTAAYRFFLSENRLSEPIRKLLRDLSLITGRRLFQERTAEIRVLVAASPVPGRILDALSAGVRLLGENAPSRWAVRSSAVGEDGRMSFAGQFDTLLDVPTEELASAYRTVLGSRYSDHAVLYRLAGGFSEVDTPMAVLVMPMLSARAAGVLYTRDPRDESADRMLIDAVEGLAAAMVRGETAALTVLARRSRPGQIETPTIAAGTRKAEPAPGRALLEPGEVRALVEVGLKLEAHRGRPLDLEWVLTQDGALRIVQCRPLRMVDGARNAEPSGDSGEPLLSGGLTVFPGRAVGPLHLARTVEEIAAAPEGAILVLRQAVPELATVLPRVAGVVAEQGNLAGHAAALAREFAVPTLFGVPEAEERLGSCKALSLDATRRLVFEGILWPEVSERTRSRIRHLPKKLASPLHERILALHLTNPMAINFRPRSCRSVHDIVRFTHEKAVAAMFDLGDEVGRERQRGFCRLESNVPLSFAVLDLGGALPAAVHEHRTVRPEEIVSPPFQALWRGMTRPGVTWTGRAKISLSGFMSVVASSMSDSRASVREVGGRNYLMVAPDYVNLNARLAYHFAMVDAFVSPVPENNFVNFRFRGGGAGEERRDLRGRFLSEVLLRSGFSVDQRGDLVTAWLRRYPRGPSEDGLATLGTLMACARQLDMLMQDESAMRGFVESFVRGDYAAFS